MANAALKLASTNSISIDKGVPLPGTAQHGNMVYPLDQMQVGDSFAVPVSKYGSLRQTAYARGFKLGMEFRVSKRGDEVRCWRIA